MKFVIVTLDSHLASATEKAAQRLRREMPDLSLSMFAVAEWGNDPSAAARCEAAIAQGDIIIVTMIFLEEHIRAIKPWLSARRDQCDAMVCCMSAAEIVKLTRMGRFDMEAEPSGPLALIKKLRGSKDQQSTAGAQQMRMLRVLPQVLRFIPGPAQDVRAYFMTLQYWLSGSDENMVNLVRYLVGRYAEGPRKNLRQGIKAEAPAQYPEIGVYHPEMAGRLSERADGLPLPPIARPSELSGEAKPSAIVGRVGLLVLRSYVLAGNARHYDGVIAAFEARGLAVVPAFATGLDAREAINKFFLKDGRACVDAVVSLTGFSLVGGPAYNDAKAAERILAELDVPYIAAHPVEFQTLEQWETSDRGLLPVESTIMIAIPELDGGTGPIVFGGRSTGVDGERGRDMHVHPERARMLASRVAKLVELRKARRSQRRLAIIIFNFPPNAGNTGTAAYLSVFESLFNTLTALRSQGYAVDVPATVDELRDAVVRGNSELYGMPANVHAKISVDDHVAREPWLEEIEAGWGPAPGKQLSSGNSLYVLGERFGNVFVGIQPAFGYEGDPMRLLFEKGWAPTHAFSAFYRFIREDFSAHAVLHFGTHGALEFMPGKQNGLSDACWPDRMIGDVPNFYLYASNNPSEGAIARRRSAATLISYLTPPVSHAGLYRQLSDLKEAITRWRSDDCARAEERSDLAEVIQALASGIDLAPAEPMWGSPGMPDPEAAILKLQTQLLELETTLIPQGLHVLGKGMDFNDRVDMLLSLADAQYGLKPSRASIERLAEGGDPAKAMAISELSTETLAKPETKQAFDHLGTIDRQLLIDSEIPALLAALDGRYIRPAPGGDLLRTSEILPTGRNLHGFDPFRIPSRFAMSDGKRQAQRLLDRYMSDGNPMPESVALVLWGTDNLKNEGAPIAQALALIGAEPRFDSYGRLAGADLIPLEALGRPRVDVVMTLSGIFRDLLPLQVKLLAEASWMAASAEEPLELNPIRRHALEYQDKHACDWETATLRVFSNADGAYGSNVNQLVDNGGWSDEDELAETYTRRKSFAYGRSGRPVQQGELLTSMLADIKLTYQNIDSVELGVTTVDHYFDTLGGISRAVRRARGGQDIPVYVGDQTQGEGKVRSLGEQVALESRTRMLNPKWYEGMLKHGYEGVRQIEVHVTNTMGWSATTGQVAPWVYQRLTETFILDDEMRERLANLNPTASARVANRLLEAHQRNYWQPDDKTLEALRRAGEELEDRIEGVMPNGDFAALNPSMKPAVEVVTQGVVA